jgi:hypothetical protein
MIDIHRQELYVHTQSQSLRLYLLKIDICQIFSCNDIIYSSVLFLPNFQTRGINKITIFVRLTTYFDDTSFFSHGDKK